MNLESKVLEISHCSFVQNVRGAIQQLIQKFLAERRRRLSYRDLLKMDNRQLKDIGLTRSDIQFGIRNRLDNRQQDQ